jgi:hypothetical protein
VRPVRSPHGVEVVDGVAGQNLDLPGERREGDLPLP